MKEPRPLKNKDGNHYHPTNELRILYSEANIVKDDVISEQAKNLLPAEHAEGDLVSFIVGVGFDLQDLIEQTDHMLSQEPVNSPQYQILFRLHEQYRNVYDQVLSEINRLYIIKTMTLDGINRHQVGGTPIGDTLERKRSIKEKSIKVRNAFLLSIIAFSFLFMASKTIDNGEFYPYQLVLLIMMAATLYGFFTAHVHQRDMQKAIAPLSNLHDFIYNPDVNGLGVRKKILGLLDLVIATSFDAGFGPRETEQPEKYGLGELDLNGYVLTLMQKKQYLLDNYDLAPKKEKRTEPGIIFQPDMTRLQLLGLLAREDWTDFTDGADEKKKKKPKKSSNPLDNMIAETTDATLSVELDLLLEGLEDQPDASRLKIDEDSAEENGSDYDDDDQNSLPSIGSLIQS